MERLISPQQAKTLFDRLCQIDPKLKQMVDDHQYFMGLDKEREVSETEAKIDYLKFHLTDYEEGYVSCFLHFIPNGQDQCPTSKSIEQFKRCHSQRDFMTGQIQEY